MNHEADVAVLGTGIAGCAAADLLARNCVRVLMISGGPSPDYAIGEHLAPHALPGIFGSGLTQDTLQSKHLSSPGVLSCWGSELPITKDYLFTPYAKGYNLDRPLLNTQFIDSALSSGSHLVVSRLTKISRDKDRCYRVVISDGVQTRSIRCRGIIDATGRSRFMARRSGIDSQHLNNFVAVASWHELNTPNTSALLWMLVEATEHGWWYSLLVPGNRLVVVLICNGSLIRGSRTERDKLLQNLIEHVPHTSARLAQTQKCLHRGVWLADTSYLTNPAGTSWVAVGDCAACFDPVIGSGISHALKSAASGADAMLKFLDGEHDALDAYAEAERILIQMNLEFQVQAYRLEQRWPTSSFWSKAQNPSSPT